MVYLLVYSLIACQFFENVVILGIYRILYVTKIITKFVISPKPGLAGLNPPVYAPVLKPGLN